MKILEDSEEQPDGKPAWGSSGHVVGVRIGEQT